jgi:predicted GIY-YIG superfamily endonuclease
MNKRQKTSHKNSSLRPMAVSSAVIALECTDKHVYIQATQDLSRDLCHHEQGTGSPFTKQHPFTGNILTVEMFSKDLQHTASRLAEEYIAKGCSVCNEFEMDAEELAEIFVMRMQPVTLTVQTYVLLCEPLPEKDYCTVYIGKTMNLTARILQHWQGTAAHWTSQHKPIRVEKLILSGGSSAEEVIQHETKLTLEYMREWMTKHGEDAWHSIRGGKYTSLQLGKPYELR